MIALGSDHGGFEIKEAIKTYLSDKGIPFIDFGTDSLESVDYPVYARKVCDSITRGESELGILCCGTGIGMSMAANKHKGIRAAVLNEEFSAEATRRHNNANILCLGGRIIDGKKAVKLTEIFINTPFDGGRHTKRIGMFE
ncbi:MAG TPA: ribose 5-phosphate isomerase B [Clostridiales bacterium]|nr:ribose 5-phosphate isomerase B [Eubacteriales bacterium]HBR30932.1 ribose 5-phosphate isomerase B [Clostridiales bacterium]